LTNKVAVVTGAAQGIGEEITIELAAAGAAVAVRYATGNKAADRVVDRIVTSGGRAISLQADDGAIPASGGSFVRRAKCLAFVLAVITGVSTAPSQAAVEDTPIAFVRAIGAQALAVIHRPDLPPSSKMSYFDELVRQDFDLTGISRFVLGPYWRVANPAQRQEFANLFTERMISVYGRRLSESDDGDFVVIGSRTDPGGVVVTSQIVPRQGAPIAVNWRLEVSDGVYKIEDVTIEGVSMALTERSEIGAQIARDGGQVGILLATMRE
jgi:phospholipid transport system substrate-binding protein